MSSARYVGQSSSGTKKRDAQTGTISKPLAKSS
jgi:hypothetical protein